MTKLFNLLAFFLFVFNCDIVSNPLRWLYLFLRSLWQLFEFLMHRTVWICELIDP